MGIPVTLLEDDNVHEAIAEVESRNRSNGDGAEEPGRENWHLVKDIPSQLGLRADSAWSAMKDRKSAGGAFWALWLDDGSRVCVVDAHGRVRETSVSFDAKITSLDIRNENTAVFLLETGICGTWDLNSGHTRFCDGVQQFDAHHRTEAFVWAGQQQARNSGRGLTHVTLSTARARYAITTSYSNSAVWADVRVLREPVCAAMGDDGDLLATSDGQGVDIHHLSRGTQTSVVGLALAENERVWRLGIKPDCQTVIIATTYRLLSHKLGSGGVSLICEAREGSCFDIDSEGGILVERRHLYGTHIAYYTFCEDSLCWSSVGYTDVRAQFGIRKIDKMIAMGEDKICVLSELGTWTVLSVVRR
ncbi:LAMI_0G10440g1_1 [Lachancea mirantina]|uniref:LAMI_0G10440g1_1 n=1 Tax=Lachancea mirantina TaxID=1230905 RepID=A0A1G4KAM3_9SACH|nr:LAMI_0G10440g1_1 [Lachancea mirantina]